MREWSAADAEPVRVLARGGGGDHAPPAALASHAAWMALVDRPAGGRTTIEPPVIYKRDPSQIPVMELVLSSSEMDSVALRGWADALTDDADLLFVTSATPASTNNR